MVNLHVSIHVIRIPTCTINKRFLRKIYFFRGQIRALTNRFGDSVYVCEWTQYNQESSTAKVFFYSLDWPVRSLTLKSSAMNYSIIFTEPTACEPHLRWDKLLLLFSSNDNILSLFARRFCLGKKAYSIWARQLFYFVFFDAFLFVISIVSHYQYCNNYAVFEGYKQNHFNSISDF